MVRISEEKLGAAQIALRQYLDPAFIVNDLNDNEECQDFQLIAEVVDLAAAVINEGLKPISTMALIALMMQSYYRGYLRANSEREHHDRP